MVHLPHPRLRLPNLTMAIIIIKKAVGVAVVSVVAREGKKKDSNNTTVPNVPY